MVASLDASNRHAATTWSPENPGSSVPDAAAVLQELWWSIPSHSYHLVVAGAPAAATDIGAFAAVAVAPSAAFAAAGGKLRAQVAVALAVLAAAALAAVGAAAAAIAPAAFAVFVAAAAAEAAGQEALGR